MTKSNNSIAEMFAELNKDSGRSVLSEEDIRHAEIEINAEMAKFNMKHRWYMAKSRESASHAYINC